MRDLFAAIFGLLFSVVAGLSFVGDAAAQSTTAGGLIIWRSLKALNEAYRLSTSSAGSDLSRFMPFIACVVQEKDAQLVKGPRDPQGKSNPNAPGWLKDWYYGPWGYVDSVIIIRGRERGCQGVGGGDVAGEQMIAQEWLRQNPTRPSPDDIADYLANYLSGGAVRGSSAERTVPTFDPRLTDDRKRLILLEEIREPQEKIQPEIALSVNPSTGMPHVRIAGRGIQAPPTIDIVCFRNRRWSLPVKTLSKTPDGNLAIYEVSTDTAAVILNSPGCHLIVVDTVIPIPLDLAFAVWAKPSTNEGSSTAKGPR